MADLFAGKHVGRGSRRETGVQDARKVTLASTEGSHDYRSKEQISYWRTTTNIDVDFILGDRIAIEAKASRNISDSDLKGLRAIHSEAPFKACILVCQEPHQSAGPFEFNTISLEIYDAKLSRISTALGLSKRVLYDRQVDQAQDTPLRALWNQAVSSQRS